MKDQLNFKGSIFSISTDSKKKSLLKYTTETPPHQFHQSMMCSFRGIEFSFEEKQKLSRNYRKNLYNYMNINLFELNRDALKLIDIINYSNQPYFKIEASDYGAFICLAALYSGKLDKNKQLEFNLINSPIGLFPKALLKKSPMKFHTISYFYQIDSWVDSFQTLCENKNISFLFNKSA